MLYIYLNLKKDGYKNKQILLYFIMYIAFAFICGKMYTVLAYGENDILSAGLSAYGGLIGVVIGSIIFERILPTDGKIIEYTILSLPLVYGLTKIACFIVGCCGGIPYDGIFRIKYVDVLNIWQFPIQIAETIIFLLIFIVCHFLKKNNNINYIVMILVSTFKFLLDFLRYDHINTLITRNQMFSIILLFITIITYIVNKNKKSIN
jgi:prolipoprotein diacylglyceryltransferase